MQFYGLHIMHLILQLWKWINKTGILINCVEGLQYLSWK